MVNPSDMAIALIALDSRLRIVGDKKERTIPLEEFFLGSSQSISSENVLEPGEIVTEIKIPRPLSQIKGVYFKERERRSWDHAMVGIAAIMAMEDEICTHIRIVLGGVAPVPLRATASEEILQGNKIDESLCHEAAEAAVRSASPLKQNAYKALLAKVLIQRAVLTA
jgi:xanthine dehydrogenase YagS FAD-binding subunit